MKTSIMSYVAASALALAAFRSAAGLLDNAWIKGTTDKDPLTYRAGEEIAITLTPMDIDGEVPAGEYALELTRSDDYGNFKTWTEPFTGAPHVYRTSLDKPGFVRVKAVVVDEKGVAYRKKFVGDSVGWKLNTYSKSPRAKAMIFFS